MLPCSKKIFKQDRLKARSPASSLKLIWGITQFGAIWGTPVCLVEKRTL